MIYLLEGPDASGKTTLVENEFISRGFTTIHNGVYPSPLEAYYAYNRQLWYLTKDSNMVIDRMHLSERIYGKIYHNRWMTDYQYNRIDTLLYDRQATLIVCLTDYETTVKLWSERLHDELVQDTDTFEKIYRQYESIIYSQNIATKYTQLPVIWYDYKNPINLEEIIR